MDTSIAVGKAPRRMCTVEDKLAIVAQSLTLGVSVAAVAACIEIERPDGVRVWIHGAVEPGVLAAVLASLAQR